MRVQIFATRIWRYDIGKRRTGNVDEQGCFSQTKSQAFAARLYSRSADRLHPASGVAAPCDHLRPGNRKQSDPDAMGGALQAHRNWPVLPESAWAPDRN